MPFKVGKFKRKIMTRQKGGMANYFECRSLKGQNKATLKRKIEKKHVEQEGTLK